MINRLAVGLQKKFNINFFLIGSKDLNKFPSVSMQILEEEYSSTKRTIGTKMYRSVKSVVQFNYHTKTALEDVEFMELFTAYMDKDFSIDFTERKDIGSSEMLIEAVLVSSVKDITEIVAGSTIWSRTVDVTFNRYINNDVTITPIEKYQGTIESEKTKDELEPGSNLEVEKGDEE